MRLRNWGLSALPDSSTVPDGAQTPSETCHTANAARQGATTSLADFWQILLLRRRVIGMICGGLLLACLLYCLIAPNQYEATAEVALRVAPATALHLDAEDGGSSAALALGQVQLETLAGMLRSEDLAWRVIVDDRLYAAPGFVGVFGKRNARLNPASPRPDAQAYLLDRFARRLTVRSLPRTMILQIRFRCADASLSAEVVNDLIAEYEKQQTAARVQGTRQATDWLQQQLAILKSQVARDDAKLAAYQQAHGLVNSPETLANGQPSDVQHAAQIMAIDEIGQELVTAKADRMRREAEYREAVQGDPEAVVAADPTLQTGTYNFSTGLLQQLRARRSDLEQEQAQLSLEHGPNFPRVLEIHKDLQNLDQQMAGERKKLLERFKAAWLTAQGREQLVRRDLEESTREGMKLNAAALQYAVMRQEAEANHQLYLQLMAKTEEAGLVAGMQTSNVEVVDPARQPVRPVSPDLPLDLSITLFVSLWLSVGGAFLMESIHPAVRSVGLSLGIVALAAALAHGQAPTPSTSGLPTGVENLPQSTERRSQPNPRQAPAAWSEGNGDHAGTAAPLASAVAETMPAPIAAGDLLDVRESHMPEFQSTVRVAADGTVTLPMVGDVQVAKLDETGAARAIEQALLSKGILLHPQVTVLVTSYVGQDVSVLGEVTHPGVYPYGVHHQLLDAIAEASGMTQSAGSLITIVHRDPAEAPQAVVLAGATGEEIAAHNPELKPGDTIEVNRAGLVYVVGDVIRPGGFSVDPMQKLTVLQALSLAWGPTMNAALTKAVLIREQDGGRTLTSLNLKRLLRGQDPDIPIEDRDILFVPDSAAKNLWNRTMESVVQSVAGVSIYAGLVYSQRF